MKSAKRTEVTSSRLTSIESSLIYAVVDALLGGRKGGQSLMIDGRGFTTIETSLVARMLSLALSDMSAALQPIAAGTAKLERIETNPRFAAIAGPTNVCAVATFRVDMDGRGGRFSILLPYATIEPVRAKLAQRFMGEKLGRDTIWESHLAAELRKTELTVSVVLGERQLPLQTVRDFAIGHTIALDRSPEDLVELQCSGVLVAHAHIGQRNRNIAIRLANDIAKEALA
jgi:flagellar motor switch protein FliM